MTSSADEERRETDRLSAALDGRYVFERELGRGGMATVYLARDLRHDRRVAVKVLHPDLAAVLGAERFLVEIRTTANLQHPHILPLFDSGTLHVEGGSADKGGAETRLFYVMPFVDGETLRARLERERQLPVDEAVRIAREVADALDYAHRHGVIHRDVKPENILLQEGHVQVADFGIALAVTRAGGDRLTQTGLSLGTPQYMAPEQATGERVIDARADVYALGAVLYEMLAGDPPFTAPTLQGVVALLLTAEPRRLSAVRRSVPAPIDAAVARALEKLPADRFASAAAFAAAMKASALGAAGEPPLAPPEPDRALAGSRSPPHTSSLGVTSPARLRRWSIVPWAVAGLTLVAGYVVGRGSAPRDRDTVVRLTAFVPGTLDLIVPRPGNVQQSLAISPDGSKLVLIAAPPNAAQSQLFLRRLDSTEPTPIPGTEGAEHPFFSPDGEWIGFVQDRKLQKARLDGSQRETIAALSFTVRGVSWGRGDVIVIGRQFGPLMRVPATGGEPRIVAYPDTSAAESFLFPQVLGDGNAALATLSVPQGRSHVVLVSLDSGDTTTVMDGVAAARYAETAHGGWLVFARADGTVMAQPFDLGSRRATGRPTLVAPDAHVMAGSGFAAIAVAENGTIAYHTGEPVRWELVVREPNGALVVLPAGSRGYRTPRFSPDGRQLAVAVSIGGNDVASDIWVYDFDRATFSRLTLDGGSTFPEYTPDGQWILYASLVRPDDRDLLRIRPSGGTPDTLLALRGQQHEAAITPDGGTLIYRQMDPRNSRDIWAIALGARGMAVPPRRRAIATTPFDERSIALSPDGRWLAYQSNESGRDEVYVRSVADGSSRWQLSPSGGDEPRWDHSGRALYYRNGDTLFTVDVAAREDSTFRSGARRMMFVLPAARDTRAAYDVSPDGRRFVFLREVPRNRPDEIRVVLHAFQGN